MNEQKPEKWSLVSKEQYASQRVSSTSKGTQSVARCKRSSQHSVKVGICEAGLAESSVDDSVSSQHDKQF